MQELFSPLPNYTRQPSHQADGSVQFKMFELLFWDLKYPGVIIDLVVSSRYPVRSSYIMAVCWENAFWVTGEFFSL